MTLALRRLRIVLRSPTGSVVTGSSRGTRSTSAVCGSCGGVRAGRTRDRKLVLPGAEAGACDGEAGDGERVAGDAGGGLEGEVVVRVL